MLLCAGDVVFFNISATNTGNLRVTGLQLDAPPFNPANLSCVVAGQHYDLSTIAAISQASVQPGQGGFCAGSYIVTPADIEAGVQNITIQLQGQSSKGYVLSMSKSVEVTPAVRRGYSLSVATALCNTPTAAGRWYFCGCLQR